MTRIDYSTAPHAGSSNSNDRRARNYDDEAINSEDEMGPGEDMDLATAAAREQHFEQQIAQRGLEVKRMAQDGNCTS